MFTLHLGKPLWHNTVVFWCFKILKLFLLFCETWALCFLLVWDQAQDWSPQKVARIKLLFWKDNLYFVATSFERRQHGPDDYLLHIASVCSMIFNLSRIIDKPNICHRGFYIKWPLHFKAFTMDHAPTSLVRAYYFEYVCHYQIPEKLLHQSTSFWGWVLPSDTEIKTFDFTKIIEQLETLGDM